MVSKKLDANEEALEEQSLDATPERKRAGNKAEQLLTATTSGQVGE